MFFCYFTQVIRYFDFGITAIFALEVLVKVTLPYKSIWPPVVILVLTDNQVHFYTVQTRFSQEYVE